MDRRHPVRNVSVADEAHATFADRHYGPVRFISTVNHAAHVFNCEVNENVKITEPLPDLKMLSMYAAISRDLLDVGVSPNLERFVSSADRPFDDGLSRRFFVVHAFRGVKMRSMALREKPRSRGHSYVRCVLCGR